MQTRDHIWVANKVAAEDEGIVAAGLQNAPGIGVVPAAAGEEGGIGEDGAEEREVDVAEIPGVEEGLFLGFGEDLFVALESGRSVRGVTKGGE